MHVDSPSVEQTVSAMAAILADYLSTEDITRLTKQWQGYSTVSVKMMQQCILDATRHYPELKANKSEIRRKFWHTLQHNNEQANKKLGEPQRETQSNVEQRLVSVEAEVFYTVMSVFKEELGTDNERTLINNMHHRVLKERTFEGHDIDMRAFLHSNRPLIPNDTFILNNLVQLAYVCLCDIVGAGEADRLLFMSAAVAKKQHAKAIVAKLF